MRFFSLVLFLFSLQSYAGTYEAEVEIVRSMDDRPCILFQLSGVSNADATGSAWFALSKETTQGFEQAFSMLLAAKMSKNMVILSTSGKECGHSRVSVIHLK